MRGPTFDEVAHVTAGVTYVEHGEFRYQPENGWLPQVLVGLPLALDPQITPPPASGRAWSRSDVWTAGRAFLFEQPRSWESLILRSRAMVVLLAVLLCGVVWWHARALWGPRGGLLALGLLAGQPDLLAHGATATSDIAAALFFLLATSAWWRLLARPSAGSAVGGGLALGALALSKASVVLLGPVLVILALLRWRQGELGAPRPVTGAAAGALLLAYGSIWVAYGLRYPTFPPGEDATFNKPLEPMLERAGGLEAPLRLAFDARLLPEPWLYGFTFVVAHSKARPAFLRGRHRADGWWWFFPFAFVAKTPVPALALLAIALALLLRGGLPPDAAPWLALLGVYWAFSITSNLNIGSRHLLPALGPLCVLGGAAARGWTGRGRLAIAALCAALALGAVVAWPRYLSWFSPVVGGSAEGWRTLVDSSLDWGQDGPALADEVQRLRRPGEDVWLSWFGSTDPRVYGIEAHPLPSFMPWVRSAPSPLTPGLYAVSATLLQEVYLPGGGPWTAADDARYASLQDTYRSWVAAAPEDEEALVASLGGPAALREALEAYDVLRFRRLASYLREQEPVGLAGWSIRIYRLTSEDLRTAMTRPLGPAG